MATLVYLLVAFIALEHLGFLVLEMFLWTKPVGRKVFRTTEEVARQSATLAQNQGLYNGFLAAGLAYGLLCSVPAEAQHLRIFFLSCVIVAGLFGAATVHRRIFFVQALPALIALLLELANRGLVPSA